MLGGPLEGVHLLGGVRLGRVRSLGGPGCPPDKGTLTGCPPNERTNPPAARPPLAARPTNEPPAAASNKPPPHRRPAHRTNATPATSVPLLPLDFVVPPYFCHLHPQKTMPKEFGASKKITSLLFFIGKLTRRRSPSPPSLDAAVVRWPRQRSSSMARSSSIFVLSAAAAAAAAINRHHRREGCPPCRPHRTRRSLMTPEVLPPKVRR